LEKKAARYGDLDRPYVIAALLEGHFYDEEFSIPGALFGREAARLSAQSDEVQLIRQPDGFWTSPGGPRYTRVSAVITAINLAPWSLARTEPHLWMNPWAKHSLAVEVPWKRTVGNPDTRLLEMTEARKAPHEILGLPPDWPGPEEPFPD
jgi:hypothetical protein